MSSQPSHIQVANLVYRYAELIDNGDFAGIGELFADATIETGEGVVYRGRDEIREMYEQWTRRYPDNGTPHTRHVTTNPILEVDEGAGTATCRSYVVVFQSTDQITLQPVITNRYHDTFRRVGDRWQFEHRLMIDFYSGDLSQHLLQDFDAEA
jgi:3-phenylpropionate/cinnamic acid dioxygenase small subunit